MSIDNIHTFTHALWDWDFLNSCCFGYTRSKVGDVDGIVEHCGEILLLEGRSMKRAPEIGERYYELKDRNNGQFKMWRALAKKGITVMIVWGKANDQEKFMEKTPLRMQVWYIDKDEPQPVIEASIEKVQEKVSGWWKWTEEKNKHHTLARNGYRNL